MTKRIFPKLFRKTATGADDQWEIGVAGRTITTRWGQIGGLLQTTSEIIAKGKCLGRVNATTPEEQAVLEAKSRWELKQKRDYTLSLADARAGKASALVAGGILPMLAHRFDEYGEKLAYPCFAQPKLDGHRCIAMVDKKGSCTLWSRTRKPINSMPHIVAAIEALGIRSTVLDGELYNHAYRAKFETLTSFIRMDAPTAGGEVVQYHVYDAVRPGDFAARTAWLSDLMGRGGSGPLVLVETVAIANEDALMAAFKKFVRQGYEGAIARNASGPYVHKRSYDLLKIKQFNDAEYRITGVEEGRGKLAGHGMFVCVTADGTEFRAKMKGELAELRKFLEHPQRYVGRMLTVQYHGLTAKSNVPRFPVALRFRKDV